MIERQKDSKEKKTKIRKDNKRTWKAPIEKQSKKC